MDKTQVDQRHLVDLYVQGKLTGDELTEFEIFMLEHPQIVDDIEYAKGMRDAIHGSKEKLFADRLRASSSDDAGGFWLNRQYAIAATVLLAVATLFSATLYKHSADLQRDNNLLREPLTISHELWLEPVRGADFLNAVGTHEIAIRQKPGEAVILRIDVSAGTQDKYTVAIADEESEREWSQAQLEPDDEKSIRLLVPRLSPGRYELTVRETSSAGADTFVARYRLLLQQSNE